MAITPSVVVKIEDENGNVLTSDTSNVTLTVQSGPGSLVGGTVTAQASGGVATFSNLILDTAGAYMLSASDGTDGLSNFASTSFTVSPTTAGKLVITTQPTGGTAGKAIASVTFTIEDQFNNVETSDSSSVLVSAGGPGSLAGGSTASVAANKGVATFSNLILDTAGGYTLSASDSTDSVSSGASNSFTIAPATAMQLMFTTPPTSGTAGSTLSPVALSIEDAFGNVETGDTSTVSIAATGPGLLTGSSTASVSAIKGVATFSNLTLDTAGSYTLKGTDAADSLASAASGAFNVNPASSDKLVFTQEPTSVMAGNAISPTVTVKIEDQNGNVLTGDDSNVSLTVDTGPGALVGGTVTAQASGGIATFSNLVLDTAGAYTLSASDTTDGLSNFSSSSFTVSPAAASKLVFTTGPVNGTAGSAISQVALSIEDQFGNVEIGDTSNVVISAAGPGAYRPAPRPQSRQSKASPHSAIWSSTPRARTPSALPIRRTASAAARPRAFQSRPAPAKNWSSRPAPQAPPPGICSRPSPFRSKINSETSNRAIRPPFRSPPTAPVPSRPARPPSQTPAPVWRPSEISLSTPQGATR